MAARGFGKSLCGYAAVISLSKAQSKGVKVKLAASKAQPAGDLAL